MPFLAEAVSLALSRRPEAHFLVVGDGDAAQVMREIAEEQGVAERFHFTGRLQGRALIDAYHAMDVFAFASHSETQGMVVAEAMAAGLPVVAVAAPGVVEVVVDGENGRLLPEDDTEGLACALEALAEARCREPLRQGALETAANYDERRCAERCLSVYRDVIARGGPFTHADDGGWDRVRGRLGAEWQMLCYRGRLLRHLVQGEWEQERPSWWPGGRQDEPSVPSE